MIDRRLLLGAAIFAIAIALLGLRPHSTPGPLLRDFEAYYAGGATFRSGVDPYARGIWTVERAIPGVKPSRDEVLPFVGPPYTLPALSLFSRLPYPIAAAVWSFVLSMALAVCVALSLRIARVRYGWISLIAGIALAVGFAPMTSDLALGQIALLSYAGALLAVTTLEAYPAASLTGTAIAALQPNVALALAIFFAKPRGIIVLVAAIVGVLGISLLAAPHLLSMYPAVISAHQAAEALLAIQQTPAAIAYGFGASPMLARAFGAIIEIAAVVVAVVAVVRRNAMMHRFVIVCAMLPLASAFFHEHDLLVAFAPAVWCARYATGRMRDLGIFATMLVAIDWLGLAQRTDGIAQSALLASAAIFGFAALQETRVFPWRGAAGVVAVFTIGAAVASLHPAPIWPDAMGTFHATAHATIAHVWFTEQTRSGLAAPNSSWALLRAFALIGSALLTYTAAKSPPRAMRS